jgi:hypothetical protein
VMIAVVFVGNWVEGGTSGEHRRMPK